MAGTEREAPVPRDHEGSDPELTAELVGAVQSAVGVAVDAALEERRRTAVEGERSRAAQAAAADVDRDEFTRRLKRVKVWAAAAVALVTAATGGVAWVYTQGQRAQAAATRELTQDSQIGATKASLETHVKAAGTASAEQSTKIRHLGALQIEHGNDQRRILLESAPKAIQTKLAEKPPGLVAAEGRVLRD